MPDCIAGGLDIIRKYSAGSVLVPFWFRLLLVLFARAFCPLVPSSVHFRSLSINVPNDTSLFDHQSVLLACAAGDRRALERLYAEESRYLLGVALRIVRQRALAEDVLHSAFINIWTRAASFDPERGSARGWIFSIVRHQALDTVRASQHDLFDDLATDESAAGEGDGNDVFACSIELQASLGKLERCLPLLDEKKRISIVYAYVDGCSHSEIADRLKAPLGSVKAWIKRGLAALRECMK